MREIMKTGAEISTLSVRMTREKRNQLKAIAYLHDKSVQEFLGDLINREIDYGSGRLGTLAPSVPSL